MKKTYISGPMTGLPDLNRLAFNSEAERLRGLGHVVINPADVNLLASAEWHEFMRADIALLMTCDRIVMLDGWTKSRGATLEHHIARVLGFEIVEHGSGS